MNNRLMWLLGAGVGAATMYYMDPSRGRYRRALARDRLVHTGHSARHGIGVVGRDMRNRAAGTTAGMRSLFDSTRPNDAVLVDRVRACLGRVVTHPASIDVQATDGIVTLSGPVLKNEVPLLVNCVRGVQGVMDVRNELEIHSVPGRVPGLQGVPRQRPGEASAFMQENWSPTARAAGGLAGAVAALYGFNRANGAGALLGTAGLLLLGRAATNLRMRRLLGIGAPRHTVEIQKTMRIDAPVETVFGLWTNFENFPSFMTHVRRVRPLRDAHRDGDRWRWTVRGPAGVRYEFDARVTAREENRLIAWSTESGALARHAGRVQFHGNPDGSTTVDVRMVYTPFAGALGHAAAWLIGADPKHQMDDDLMRMKSFLETGRRPHDAAARRAGGPSVSPIDEHRRRASSNGGSQPEQHPDAAAPL